MSEETLYGVNLFGEPNSPTRPNLTSERFLIPPFSVLNAREGFWQERKRAWISLGIKSEGIYLQYPPTFRGKGVVNE